jgi:glucose-1-phosphatase
MENNYKAIIFDFGNVIIDIDLNLTYQKFAELTFKKPEKIKSIFEENILFEKF